MKIVSLFSGAGGLDLGLIQSGHQIVWANDIFHDAAETYRLNIGDHISERDIKSISSQDIPECDVVVGGFPCQGFSVANTGRNSNDSRNHLYLEMVRIVNDKKPRFFVAENVRGLISFAKGAVLRLIMADFEKAGYFVRYALVNAADYGVPQNRMRVIIFGIRNDLNATTKFPPPPSHYNPLLAKSGQRHWLSVGKALSLIPEPEDAPDLPNHTCSKYKLRFNGYLGHRRVDPDAPAPTITARGDDKGGVVVIHHPRNHRRMTARELATVQSFPADFVFFGTRTSAYRQIANAVPPLLGRAIGKMLKSAELSLYANCNTNTPVP